MESKDGGDELNLPFTIVKVIILSVFLHHQVVYFNFEQVESVT